MTIKVKVSTMELDQIVAILEHYNSNKPPSYPPLEKLNRYESGFQIKIREKEFDHCDANEKIKQLRWYKKQLIPYRGYPSFNGDEETLLLNALKYVLSEENVEEEICDAVNEKICDGVINENIKQLIEYTPLNILNGTF